MKLAFVVNDLATETAGYTTTRLGAAAVNRGHEVWTISVGDLAFDADDVIRARGTRPPKNKYASPAAYLKDIQGTRAVRDRISLEDLDVLLLRNDPSTESGARVWARTAAIDFGRAAMRHGVIVLNDPNGLAKAMNKMYLQSFPPEVRPRTLITRSEKEIKDFANAEGGRCVLKPLLGSGGENVFLIRPDDVANINQIIHAVSRDGYVIAQEYLAAAEAGDTRLFLMNGDPLRHRGKYAAFRRVRSGGDMRSNLHAGGRIARAELDDDAFRLAAMVKPKLMQDGMFLVGLDIVGDKLMEINVFSPGGLGSAHKMEGAQFTQAVLNALERKVTYMSYYRRNFDNVEMATL